MTRLISSDLSIIFDLQPEIGLARINKDKNREVNRIDKEKIEFHKKVREGYKKILSFSNRNIVKINADKPIDEVFIDVKKLIEGVIKNK